MADPGNPHPHESDDRFVGSVLADRYEIRGRLGKGGMAIVYEALDRSFERVVAIKVLRTDVAKDPVAAKRLVREARAAGQLHHPNIIMMHDAGEMDGMVYIVMELMKGRELAELMEEQAAIGVRRALVIGRQVASALTVAHAHGIIHRDIKPENLFLLEHDGEGDFIKVLDFSIAKLPTSMVTAALTRAGSVFGTPHYMAPEQVEGRTVCPQTDLYALGAVIFELIAGQPPFDGDSVIDILLQHAKRAPPKLASVAQCPLPPGLSELIDSLLSKKESDRPASAEVVEAALERMIGLLDLPPADQGLPDGAGEDKPTMALPALVVPQALLPDAPSGPPPSAPPPSAPAPVIIRAPARPSGARPTGTPGERAQGKATGRPAAAGPATTGGGARPGRASSAVSGRRAPAGRPQPTGGTARPAPPQEDAPPSESLSLPSGPIEAGRKGFSKGVEANTLIGHGLAEQVRAAAARADREAAAASGRGSGAGQPSAAPGLSLVPPPPSGRADVPAVFAPGALDSHTDIVAPRRAPPPAPAPGGGEDGVPTQHDLHIDDVRQLQRSSQETLAVPPSQLRDLSQQLKVGPRRNLKLLWVAVPVAVLGVVGLAIAAWYLMGGN